MKDKILIKEIKDFYKVTALKPFRKTKGVVFEMLPVQSLEHIDAIDKVVHNGKAFSPGPVENVQRPWYMHPGQDDNLIVLQGARLIELYSLQYKKVESFTVTADRIEHNGQIIYENGVMISWPRGVFHRIQSFAEGSISINFAVQSLDFDIKTNFSIYDLDLKNGQYQQIRKGELDQF